MHTLKLTVVLCLQVDLAHKVQLCRITMPIVPSMVITIRAQVDTMLPVVIMHIRLTGAPVRIGEGLVGTHPAPLRFTGHVRCTGPYVHACPVC